MRLHKNCKNWLYLLLLVEFQSTDDPLMALRILTYTGLLYQELARNGQLDADGRLPAVLPLVLYNGDEPWVSPLQMGELIAPVGPSLAPYQPAQRYFVLDERRLQADDLPIRNRMSAVIALEQSRSPRDVAQVADMLAAWAAGPAGARTSGDLPRRLDAAIGGSRWSPEPITARRGAGGGHATPAPTSWPRPRRAAPAAGNSDRA